MLIGCNCYCKDNPPDGSSQSGVSASVSFSASVPPKTQVSCSICIGKVAPLSWDVSFNYGNQFNPLGGRTILDYPCLATYANRTEPYRCVFIGQCETPPGSPFIGYCRWRSPELSVCTEKIVTGASTTYQCITEPITTDFGAQSGQWHRVYIFMGFGAARSPGCTPDSYWQIPGNGGMFVLIRYGGMYDRRFNQKSTPGTAFYVLPYGSGEQTCLRPITLRQAYNARQFPWGQGLNETIFNSPSGYSGQDLPDPNLPATITLTPGPL